MKKPDVVIRPASDLEIDAFSGYDDKARIVTYAEVLVEGDMMLAMGSVADFKGLPVVSMDISPEGKRYAVRMIRAVRRWMKANEGPFYALSQNPVLLSKLGFTKTAFSIDGKELWIWQS